MRVVVHARHRGHLGSERRSARAEPHCDSRNPARDVTRAAHTSRYLTYRGASKWHIGLEGRTLAHQLDAIVAGRIAKINQALAGTPHVITPSKPVIP